MKVAFVLLMLATSASAAPMSPTLDRLAGHPIIKARTCYTTCTRDTWPPYTQHCTTNCY